jgi:hypothetical protein
MAFNICPPQNITNLFGICLAREEIKKKAQIQAGVFALLWAIWNVQNDYIFTDLLYLNTNLPLPYCPAFL